MKRLWPLVVLALAAASCTPTVDETSESAVTSPPTHIEATAPETTASATTVPAAEGVSAESDDTDAAALAAAALIARHASTLIPARTERGMTPEAVSAMSSELDRRAAALEAQIDALASSGIGGDRAQRIASLVEELVSNAREVEANRPELLAEIAQVWQDIATYTALRNVTSLPALAVSSDNFFASLVAAADTGSVSGIEDDVGAWQSVMELWHSLDAAVGLMSVLGSATDLALVGRWEEILATNIESMRQGVNRLTAAGSSELDPRVLPSAREVLAANTGPDALLNTAKARIALQSSELGLIARSTDALGELLFEIESLVAEVQGTPLPLLEPASDQSVVPGVSGDHVSFGQSAALSGPAQPQGDGMRLGIETAFAEANSAGGVHGRTLSLTTFDDRYEPELAYASSSRLIRQEQVFALIGPVGTPTSRSVLPLVQQAGVPYIGAFTGAALLRTPELDGVVNLRASYAQETETMIERLTADLGITRVAVLYQLDSYGIDGLDGVRAALGRRGLEPVASWYYQRNTDAVNAAAAEIAAAMPEAVLIIGTHAPAAQLVELLRADIDPVFMAVSFVGADALADALGENGAGFYVTQVVPLPDDSSNPVVVSYRNALAAYAPDAEPGFVSLEGYLVGRLAIAGLEACGADLSRECFLDGIFGTASFSIDGFELAYGPGDNQGSDAVFVTVIDYEGQFRVVDRLTP